MIIYTENRTKNILLAVIIVLLLLAAFVFYQQKTITDLKNKIIGRSAASLNGRQGIAINSPFTVRAVQKNLTDNVNEIKGSIISKSDSLLTVEAEIVDFSKLSKLPEDELEQNVASFPKIKKNYEVLIDENTQLGSLKPKDLLPGKVVVVESGELVYTSNRLKAVKITIVGSGDALLGRDISIEDRIKQMKDIGGTVKELGDKYLVVSVNWLDYSKISDPIEVAVGSVPTMAKDYKVHIDGKTKFVDKSLNELKVGDSILVFSSDPIYSINEFTATKIERSHAYSDFPGQVIDIDKDKRVFMVKASDGGKMYKVKITDETGIYRNDLSEIQSDGQPKRAETAFSDIQINDQISVLIRGDLGEETEIEAAYILKV